MDRIYNEKIQRRTTAILLLLALALAGVVTMSAYQRAEAAAGVRLQEHLAQEVLRFHVLADSNSEEDQAVKLKVRDGVLDYLEREMPETLDAAQTAEWVREHTDEIEDVSREIVAAEGKDDTVSAAVTTCWFPEKSYGDLTFPAGNYKALRIEIGAAEGQNWWCVLYPALCFLDTTNAVVPDEGKQKLKNVLTEEEYSRVTADTEFKISWYFW